MDLVHFLQLRMVKIFILNVYSICVFSLSVPKGRFNFSINLVSDEGVLWSLYPVMHCKSSWVVKAEAGVNIISEVTLKGVQMLFQIHIKEGQSPPMVVQSQPYPHWIHCDPQVWTAAAVKELIFVPEEKLKVVQVIGCPQGHFQFAPSN